MKTPNESLAEAVFKFREHQKLLKQDKARQEVELPNYNDLLVANKKLRGDNEYLLSELNKVVAEKALLLGRLTETNEAIGRAIRKAARNE